MSCKLAQFIFTTDAKFITRGIHFCVLY